MKNRSLFFILSEIQTTEIVFFDLKVGLEPN